MTLGDPAAVPPLLERPSYRTKSDELDRRLYWKGAMGDISEPDGRPFIVMKLLRGWPLPVYSTLPDLGLKGNLDFKITPRNALSVTHAAGVCHRDTTPTDKIWGLRSNRGQVMTEWILIAGFFVAFALFVNAIVPGALTQFVRSLAMTMRTVAP
jgi:hypothetical protein